MLSALLACFIFAATRTVELRDIQKTTDDVLLNFDHFIDSQPRPSGSIVTALQVLTVVNVETPALRQEILTANFQDDTIVQRLRRNVEVELRKRERMASAEQGDALIALFSTFGAILGIAMIVKEFGYEQDGTTLRRWRGIALPVAVGILAVILAGLLATP